MYNKAETIMTSILNKKSAKAVNESYADWENEVEMPLAARNSCYVSVSGISMQMGI
jgi:hypothetical protein